MLIKKITAGFSGEKVPRTPVVLKMAISILFSLEKKMVYMILSVHVLQALYVIKQYIITKEFYSKQSNQSRYLFH